MNENKNARLAPGASNAFDTSNSTRSPADTLLSRLDYVKETGPGRWIARCPAHDDRRPSLSVRETDDGTLLVKCWPGCTAAEIVAAVGLRLSDLFPERPENQHFKGPTRKRRWPAGDILACLAVEARVAALAAGDLAAGEILPPPDVARLGLAASRLKAGAAEVAR